MARPTTPPVDLSGPTKLLINGEWLEPATGRHYDDINPSTGEVVASVAEAGAEDVDRAVKAARAVNREDITKGAEQLGVDLDEHIAFVIEALKPVAAELGIAGTSPA